MNRPFSFCDLPVSGLGFRPPFHVGHAWRVCPGVVPPPDATRSPFRGTHCRRPSGHYQATLRLRPGHHRHRPTHNWLGRHATQPRRDPWPHQVRHACRAGRRSASRIRHKRSPGNSGSGTSGSWSDNIIAPARTVTNAPTGHMGNDGDARHSSVRGQRICVQKTHRTRRAIVPECASFYALSRV